MNNWQELNTEEGLTSIQQNSYKRPQLIFKHSTRCGISSHVFHTLSAAAEQLADKLDLHYLDLIAFRALSNQVSSHTSVPHQSPQVIVLKDGKVVHHASHFSIQPEQILQASN